MKVIYWLAIFIVLLIIEIATMGLTTIWFAGGALIAFCAGLVGFGLGVQVGTFIVVSLLLLLLTRPLAVKYFNQERQKTNAESLIGQQALVTEDIDTNKGQRAGRDPGPDLVGRRRMSRTEQSRRTQSL